MSFFTWFRDHGGYMNNSIEPSTSDEKGLRVRPGDTITPDTCLVCCPHDLTISWADACKSPLFSKIIPMYMSSPRKQTIITRLFLMEQYLLQEDSFWWPYIHECLPQPYQRHAFSTPLYFDDEDMVWLRGTNLEKASKSRADSWRRQFEEALPVLFPDDIRERRRLWTWELYLWAATVLSSRSFEDAALQRADVSSPILIPGCDLFNHSPTGRITWLWESNACRFIAEENIDGGNQILNNYGFKGNEELLAGYGFALPNNPADHFALAFSRNMKEPTEAIESPLDTITDLVTVVTESRAPPDLNAQQFQHSVCLVPGPIHLPAYRFTPGFLSGISSLASRGREILHPDTWAELQTTISPQKSSRNKLRVIGVLIMHLQRKASDIRIHDEDLPESPEAKRQEYAKIYRDSQLRILDGTIGSLHYTLRSISMPGPKNGVLTLQDILTRSPQPLARDFRKTVHMALRTRDKTKIEQRGGQHFTFGLWLCGVVISELSGELPLFDYDHWGTRISKWIKWLRTAYGPNLGETPDEESRTGQPGTDEPDDETRNVEIIKSNIEENQSSLYASSAFTVSRLKWCNKVIMEERVMLPDSDPRKGEEADEFALFLEIGENED